MNLRLIREPSRDGCTHGSLYIDGHWHCWTIEDVVREVEGQPVADWKVKGRTAIPSGRYKVAITHSQRFGRSLPLLVDVDGFEGVRIHPGNTSADTEGCILPGTGRVAGRVTGSRVAFERLFEHLVAARDDTWIRIENPYGEGKETA